MSETIFLGQLKLTILAKTVKRICCSIQLRGLDRMAETMTLRLRTSVACLERVSAILLSLNLLFGGLMFESLAIGFWMLD